MSHPELKYYAVDLSVLLEYLIEKHVIQTIKVDTKGQGVFHRYYQIVKIIQKVFFCIDH